MKSKMCDADGNEMVLKPGHMWVMGKEAFGQVPILEMEEPKGITAEFGSDIRIRFPQSDGSIFTVGPSDE